MEHPLQGFILKLNRAEEHLNAIKKARSELRESHFYDISTEPDYKRRPVARFINVEPIKPGIAVLIGDCVHNFRSALDHLGFQLAITNSPTLDEKFIKRIAFPIFDTGPKYRRKGAGGATYKMPGMSRRARRAIERLQPYHRRKNPALWALWQLDEMWQMDKHRLIHLTGAAPESARVSVHNINTQRFGIRQFSGPIEEGARFAMILGDLPAPAEVNVEADITPDIVFDKRTEASSVRGHSVIDTLGAIRQTIGMNVLPELDDELRRLFPGSLQITIS